MSETAPKPKRPAWVNFWDHPDLVDLVVDPFGAVKFLLRTDRGLVLDDELTFRSDTAKPFTTELYPLPTSRAVEFLAEDDELLFSDLCRFIKAHVELPRDQPVEYAVLAAWVLHSYLMERFTSTPYLYFFGPFESGKTRANSTLRQLARHGLSTVGITEAALFRANEFYRPSFFLDELHLGKDSSSLLDLLNARYKRGMRIVRVNCDKTGPDSLESFEVFGPTSISTTASFLPTLQSRCLTFSMMGNRRQVRDDIDLDGAAYLRDRLTGFRARHFQGNLPKPSERAGSGRLSELVGPLHQMIVLAQPGLEPAFVAYVTELNAARKAELQQDSIESEVVAALMEIQQEIVDGKFEPRVIARAVNRNREPNEIVHPRKIGQVLKRLGFPAVPHHGETRMRFFNQERYGRLVQKFGLKPPESHVPMSQAPAPNGKSSDEELALGQAGQVGQVETYDGEVPEVL